MDSYSILYWKKLQTIRAFFDRIRTEKNRPILIENEVHYDRH